MKTRPRREFLKGLLALEPDNRYDPRAVRIEAFGRHIGYVPRRPDFDTVMVAVSLGIGGR